MFEKHAFVRYLISQHTFKKPRALWILNFFSHNEEYLENLHFVEDVTGCPRSLILSTYATTTSALLFSDKEGETSSADTIIERIKQGKNEALYVQINFPKWQGNMRYLKILEDNPFVDGLPHQNEVSRYADEIIAEAIKEMEKKRLTEEIDEALDAKDRPLFETLVKKLAEL